MARINDVPPSEGCFETMKRRYVRQNRELARCNSMQSQRIRVLEGEISRLLSINAEISQENISLRVELDNRPGFEGVQSVKHKLEQQMIFLGGLVEDLAAMQRRPDHGERPKMAVKPERSDRDRVEDEERRLSVIREDNIWQRESTDARSSCGTAESLDLGPPPVADSLVDEDPVKIEPVLQHSESMEDQETVDQGPEELINSLAMNLETRKRRRDSGRRATITSSSTDATMISGTAGEDLNFRPTGKLGLKRKLDVRDDDAERRAKTPDLPTESIRLPISRRTENLPPQTSSIRERRDSQRVSRTGLLRDRRPFSEKPVNTDPVVSPKKPRRGLLTEKSQKPPTVSFAKEHLPPLVKTTIEPTSIDDMELEPSNLAPKTPGLADVFSPPSQPSTERPVAKDTPPPADLSSSTTSTGMEPISRGGARRARAVVNYAEPSLNTKMRRPTKELVNAVGIDGRPIAGTIVRREGERSSDQWQPKSALVSDAVSTTQREEAASPLVSKIGPPTESVKVASEAPVISRKLPGRHAVSGQDLASKKEKFSTAKSLLERPSTNLETRRKKIEDIKAAEADVYDFNESSPLTKSGEESQSQAAATKTSHRRHSSMVDIRSRLENTKPAGAKKGLSNLPGTMNESTEDVLARSSRSVSRRKSMMV